MTGMEPVLVGLSAAGSVMQAMGTIAAGNAAAAEGEAMRQAQEYKAKQMDVQAGQERAAAQRNAIEARRKGRYAASRGLAVASASGGGAADPTIVNLLGDIQAEGEYQALLEMYGGEERARGLEHGAAVGRYEGEMAYAAGKAKQRNSRYAAMGQLAMGAGQAGYMGYKMGMFNKFNPTAGLTKYGGYVGPGMWGPYTDAAGYGVG